MMLEISCSLNLAHYLLLRYLPARITSTECSKTFEPTQSIPYRQITFEHILLQDKMFIHKDEFKKAPVVTQKITFPALLRQFYCSGHYLTTFIKC